jgi:PAS domain S-box-containing protein
MASSAAESLPKGNTATTEETPIHILYVDDEAGLLKAAKSILEMQGSLHVETAVSVEEAIKKMEEETFDVIVSDYIMPGKDGLEFLKELRDSGNRIPFIIFTGKGREIVAIKALNLGADQYVNKIGKPEAVYSELAHGIRTVVKGKKAEEALRESEKERRAVLDSMSELVIHQDLKHRILWVNRKAADSVNMKVEQLKGHYCHELWAKSASPCLGCPLEETIKTGELQQGEITTPDGRVWSINGSPIIDANGNVTSVVEVVTNITEQKKAEEKLRKSEAKYRALVENIGNGIATTDLEGRLVFVNQALCEMVGYSEKELIGKPFADFLHPDDKKRMLQIFLDGWKNPNRKFSIEFRVIHKKGHIVHMYSSPTTTMYKNKIVGFNAILSEITKLKKAEEKLRESEEKFRNLAEKSPNMIFINRKGRVVYANKRCEEVMGYRREEFYSPDFNFFTLIAPESIEQLRSSYSRHLKGDEILPYEYTLITKEGKRIESILTSKLITYEGEKAILGIITDITERKRIEEGLRKRELYLRKTQQIAHFGSWVLDVKTNRVEFSDEMFNIFGITKEQFSFTPEYTNSLVQPEDRARVQEHYEDLLIRHKPVSMEYSIIRPDGSVRHLWGNGEVEFDEKGNLQYLIGTVLDITEHKKTNEKLKESERKYRLLTENITDVIYIQDMNLNVTYASPSVEKISGYTPEELSKLKPENFMTPESFERGVAEFKEAITSAAEETDYEIPLKQYEYVRKDGSTFWGELKMKLLRDSNNNLVGIQGTLRDITERKEAEKKLDEMMNELVTINEKLGVVGRLTRHDARNKLSVIANNVYLAKQKLAADHGALEFLGDVESVVAQIEEIFDFSRNYEMLGVEDLSYMNVGNSVEEATILLSGMNEVKLVNECKGLVVMADSLLRQLFYNLIDNTLKYGEKVSQIRVYHEEGENQLKLVYEDDGVGIPENEKEKLFKEGYGKSTGYGLYLIKKICEAYGWTIRETGKQGKGAQFTMTIPKTTKNGKKSYRID